MLLLLRSPTPLLEKCLCQSKTESDNFGRTQPGTLASSPPPSRVTWCGGLPGGLLVLEAALPAPGFLWGGNAFWLFTVPGSASWLQSQLAASWARSPASLGPRSGCLRPTPQSLDFLSFSFFPSLFSLWRQIWVSFLVSFPPPFFFPFAAGGVGGEGAAWRALK